MVPGAAIARAFERNFRRNPFAAQGAGAAPKRDKAIDGAPRFHCKGGTGEISPGASVAREPFLAAPPQARNARASGLVLPHCRSIRGTGVVLTRAGTRVMPSEPPGLGIGLGSKGGPWVEPGTAQSQRRAPQGQWL